MEAPEYTELEKQGIKDKWNSLTNEQKAAVMKAFRTIESNDANEQAPVVDGVATLTYKQLAKNFNTDNKQNVERSVRQAVRRMNRRKDQVRVVNKPGATIQDKTGTYMITKKGKSIRIGD
ncbi:MAG TPA: hypothetical protein VIM16_00810 [Mucilaginibacter sp.]|jgi:predicted Fe-S protein YdhL (DUF1289 family)